MALWRTLQPQLQKLVRQHVADSTASQYAASELYYLRFLAVLYGASANYAVAAERVLEQLARPSDGILALYVAYLAQAHPTTGHRTAFSTIRQYMKGVGYCLRMYGHSGILASMPTTRMALQGARRHNSTPSRAKAPITPEMLTYFLSSLSRSHSAGATMAAAMVICFFAMLRKCAVCVDRAQPASSFSGLLRRDITVSESGALVIDLRHSKTNQYGDRVTCIQLACRPGHPLDPVAAYQRMCALCPAPADFPAFSMTMAGAPAALCHQDFVATTKQLVARMGGDAVAYSGHSYRRGGATCAHAAGVPGIDIMRTGDWLSDQYLDYIWRTPAQCVSCSSLMLDAIAAGSLTELRMGVMRR